MTGIHILLIECGDEKGLVHRITGVLFRHGLNIVSNHEFVDREAERFFMRTEFAGDFDPSRVMEELKGLLPGGARIAMTPRRKKEIIVMASTEHHCLGDLLLRHEYGRLNARINAVVSNHDALEPLVRKFGIPFHCIPAGSLDRERHEALVIETLARYQHEYLVLAKYMRILSPGFVAGYPNRIVNIHHSFLPAFVGADPYRQAYERGVKIIGATAHFVTESLDEGPIIAQSVITVDHTRSAEDMMQAGRDVEKTVLATALRLAFEERIFVCGNRTIIFD